MPVSSLPAGDQKLIQIVDAELAKAVHKSGKWLACRIGCAQCCVGVFAITQLDAARLRAGIAELEQDDPDRANRVRGRVHDSVSRLKPAFPGDFATGLLGQDEDALDAFD